MIYSDRVLVPCGVEKVEAYGVSRNGGCPVSGVCGNRNRKVNFILFSSMIRRKENF